MLNNSIYSGQGQHRETIPEMFTDSCEPKPPFFPADTMSPKVSPCQLRHLAPISPLVTCWSTSLRSRLTNLPLIRLLMVWIHWEWSELINFGPEIFAKDFWLPFSNFACTQPVAELLL